MRTIGERGLALVKASEGLALSAYRDAVGIWTIGYGSTKGVHEGDTIDQPEAERRLKDDLRVAEACVNLNCPHLTQNQFDALVSLSFNVGCHAFTNSTLRRLVCDGDFAGAANQFERWNHAGDRVLPGLTARRSAERELFVTPDHTEEPAP